jgi:hypothetical protein
MDTIGTIHGTTMGLIKKSETKKGFLVVAISLQTSSEGLHENICKGDSKFVKRFIFYKQIVS